MSLVDRIKAIKRYSLALMTLSAYLWGGLYLVLTGALKADIWFGSVATLAGIAMKYYFDTRERREGE